MTLTKVGGAMTRGVVRVIDTIDTLIALPAAEVVAGEMYRVTYRDTSGDNGGGEFECVAGTATEDYGEKINHATLSFHFRRNHTAPRVFSVLAFGETGTADDSTTCQRALNAAETAGGGVVYFPGPKTYRYKNLQVASNIIVKFDAGVTSILPESASITDKLWRNKTTTAYTDTNIHFECRGAIFDGNDQGAGGAQSRFTELLGFQRITGFSFVGGIIRNCQFIGLALAGVRNFVVDCDMFEDIGFSGATSNGGPPLWISSVSADQSEMGTVYLRGQDLRWGNHINGRKISIKTIQVYNGGEAGVYSPDDPTLNIINEDVLYDGWNIDGIAKHDISASGAEISGERLAIGGGTITHVDDNGIALGVGSGVTRHVRCTGPLTISDFSEGSTISGSPDSVAFNVFSVSASPLNTQDVDVSGITIANTAKTATCTISQATPAVITSASHGLRPLDMVKLTTTGTLPTGLSPATKYFVSRTGFGLNSFQLSATRGGSSIPTSSAGSGTHTWTKAVTAYAAFAWAGSGDNSQRVRFDDNNAYGISWTSGAALYTAKAGTGCRARNNGGIANYIPTTTLASAATTSLCSVDDDYVAISGTTTITSFGAGNEGTMKWVRFTGALQITHNATSMINKTSANITTAADDTALFRCLGGSNWMMILYQEKNGTALA